MGVSPIASTAEGSVDRLVFDRFFRNRASGVFVDVGAGRPDFLSNSATFRAAGWQVIAIEPNPTFAREYRDRGIDILEYACADHDEDDRPFVVADVSGLPHRHAGVTFESYSALEIKPSYAAIAPQMPTTTIRVTVRRLDRLLREHAPEVSHIEVLSVDVEGWELEVLAGANLSARRPDVLIVENLFTQGSYRAAVHRYGYGLWRRVRPNDVYVRRTLLTGAERIRGNMAELRYNAYGVVLSCAVAVRRWWRGRGRAREPGAGHSA